MPMFKIERKVYVPKKPLWMQSLLFNVNPSWYEPFSAREECQKTLTSILGVVNGYSYRWHQKYARISDIGQVVTGDGFIKILTKRGKLFLSFIIIECTDTRDDKK